MLEYLRRLFGSKEISRPFTDRLKGPGTFSVEVVAEPHDAHNLDLVWTATSNQWKLRQSPEGDSWEHATDAKLVSESVNPRGPHAICVEIAGKKVGNLSRADALKLHRRLTRLGYDRIDSVCKSRITGRPKFWVMKLDLAENLIGQTDKDKAAEP